MKLPTPDWSAFLHSMEGATDPEFDLGTMQNGDTLRVITGHTAYTLRAIDWERRDAWLTTDRDDRPSGPVRVMGCTFGLSSTIKPNHLFCGGNLEFTFDAGRMTHTTTAITGIQWFRTEREKD